MRGTSASRSISTAASGMASTASTDFLAGLSMSSMTAESKDDKGCAAATTSCCARHGSIIRRSPSVAYIPFLVFALLTAAGLAVILTTARSERKVAEQEAISQAEDTGRWFSNQLDKALAPVFSLAQFATEIEEFQSLPEVVGPAYESGSLPFLAEPTVDNIPTNRDISGSSLEDPKVLDRFNRIASTIKEHANLPGVLVNLQLAPHGVVSLAYPLNNTVDFPRGVYLDSASALGLDLFTHPLRKAGAEASVRTTNMVVIGPLQLTQCSGAKECHPVVKQAFIARLPIPSLTHQITISDGQIYRRWGFATGIINWHALVQQSGLYESFAAKSRQFRLSKTQVKCGSSGEACTRSSVELAKTPDFSETAGSGLLSVTVDLETTVNEWQMTVNYHDPTSNWLPGAITAVVLISLAMGLLVYFILYQRQVQADLAAEKQQTHRKIRSLERKKNDMEKKLKDAYTVIETRRLSKSNVGVVSSMRKIGRLEEEMAEVDKDIEGLEQYVHQLASAATNKPSSPGTSRPPKEILSKRETSTALSVSMASTAGESDESLVEV